MLCARRRRREPPKSSSAMVEAKTGRWRWRAPRELASRSEKPSAAGNSIGQLQLRTKTGVSVIAIVHDGTTEINPGPESVLNPDDVLVLLGTPENIDRAIEKCLS